MSVTRAFIVALKYYFPVLHAFSYSDNLPSLQLFSPNTTHLNNCEHGSGSADKIRAALISFSELKVDPSVSSRMINSSIKEVDEWYPPASPDHLTQDRSIVMHRYLAIYQISPPLPIRRRVW